MYVCMCRKLRMAGLVLGGVEGPWFHIQKEPGTCLWATYHLNLNVLFWKMAVTATFQDCRVNDDI